jgi:hypothetical protein
MKSKNTNKKLSLTKSTIQHLNDESLNNVKAGGTSIVNSMLCTLPIYNCPQN